MELLPYTTCDADRARRLFRARAGTYFDPAEAEDFEETLEFIRDPGDAPEQSRFWSGWLGDEMMAFGGVEWIDDAGYLCWGMVHPEFAGRGYGRQLLLFRLNLLRDAAVKSVFSDTSQLTEGFFARHGFECYFRRPQHFGPSLDLVAMELSFDGARRGPRRVRPDGTLGFRVGADRISSANAKGGCG